jgi:hypothetical protein
VSLTKGSVKMKVAGLPRLPAAAPLGAGFDAYVYKAYLLSSTDPAVEVYLADVFPSSSGAAKIKVAPKGRPERARSRSPRRHRVLEGRPRLVRRPDGGASVTSRAALLRARRLALALALLMLPALARAACAPSARGIFPASGIVGTTVDATVEGSALAGATVAVFGDPGLVATVQSSNDLTVDVRIAIDVSAAPGERILAFTTSGGTVAVSFTVNVAGGPVVADVSPPLLATTGLPLNATVAGAGLAGVSPASVAVSGEGVSVATATPAPDGASLALGFAVDAAADLGTHAVTIANGLGSATLMLYVQRPAPIVTQVAPRSRRGRGQRERHVVRLESRRRRPRRHRRRHRDLWNGDARRHHADCDARDRPGRDDQHVGGTPADRHDRERADDDRVLRRPADGSERHRRHAGRRRARPDRPRDAPWSQPHRVRRSANPAPISRCRTRSPSTTRPSRSRWSWRAARRSTRTTTLTVTTGSGVANVTFRVIGVGKPFFNAARPPFGNRGTIVTVRLDGVNLGTIVPGTGIQLSGPKITESNALALDAATAQATLDIDPTASVGYRDVTVTTTGGTFTRSSGFRVNVPGQVPMITDVSPAVVRQGRRRRWSSPARTSRAAPCSSPAQGAT